ncbi:MAG: glycogen debranching N-terminal domain-containing protein, partial [Kovacikia sp.]
MKPEILALEGKTFIPADQLPISEWDSALSERPQPTLTLKDDDLFLLTDTLGNISGSVGDDRSSSMGLFCKDTRFLSRLELQIEGRSPILLSSTADKGFVLSVLCTNPRIDEQIKAESVGIKRELVLNGGLFEEIEISNYSTSSVTFELSLSFGADFLDLFEIRGYGREKRGRLLRVMPQHPQEQAEERKEPREADDPGEKGEGETEAIGAIEDELLEEQEFPTPNPQPVRLRQVASAHAEAPHPTPAELLLAYQGLDGGLLESRIEFSHRQPDLFKGDTAIWQLHLESHETQVLGYRLQMLNSNRPASTVSPPGTLGQAKAAELMEEQTWRQQVTHIRSDKNTFNQILERAEQDIYLLRQSFGKGKALSAGVPWFSTLFGRDSIIAASQILMLDSQIARETLCILAQYQGQVDDEWRDEQPGKILHEIRFGEMARCQEIPHTPYYGTVDATPLWLMLYA